jgi:hypothetical protein
MTKRDAQLADYRAELAMERERTRAMAARASRLLQWQHRKIAEMEARATRAWFEALDGGWEKLSPAKLPTLPTELPTLGDGTLPPDEE